MSKIEISYNPATDHTTITESAEFKELSCISQLDTLQDAIYLLEKLYNRKLSKLFDKKQKEQEVAPKITLVDIKKKKK